MFPKAPHTSSHRMYKFQPKSKSKTDIKSISLIYCSVTNSIPAILTAVTLSYLQLQSQEIGPIFASQTHRLHRDFGRPPCYVWKTLPDRQYTQICGRIMS